MKDWSKPQVIDRLTQAFPVEALDFMPTWEEIPLEFKQFRINPWSKWQAKWFFFGLTNEDIPEPKDGIDLDTALVHLATIQGSWSPKHEHKEAAVAYLASLWFKNIPVVN